MHAATGEVTFYNTFFAYPVTYGDKGCTMSLFRKSQKAGQYMGIGLIVLLRAERSARFHFGKDTKQRVDKKMEEIYMKDTYKALLRREWDAFEVAEMLERNYFRDASWSAKVVEPGKMEISRTFEPHRTLKAGSVTVAHGRAEGEFRDEKEGTLFTAYARRHKGPDMHNHDFYVFCNGLLQRALANSLRSQPDYYAPPSQFYH